VSEIAVPLALYVLSQWLARSLAEIRTLIYGGAEQRMFTRISDRVFEHVMQLPLRFHLQRATGAVHQTLQNGLQGFQIIAQRLVFLGLPVVVQLVTTIWILYRIHQQMFVIVFICAVACYASTLSFFLVRITRSAEAASESHVAANGLMTDAILNYETVKFFTAEEAVRSKVQRAFSETENRWVRFYQRYALNGLFVAALVAVFLAVSITLAFRELVGGRMTVGGFVLVNTYMLQLMQPIEMLGYTVQGLAQGGGMLKKMMAVLGEQQEVPSSAADHQTRNEIFSENEPSAPATVEFRDVSMSYQTGRPTLRHISFVLPAGKTLGIVGASGAGKSTIVRLLVRLLESDSGEILFDGVSTSNLRHRDVRRAVAVVPQDTVLFNETIGYNIAFGRLGCTQEEIEHAARVAHLDEFIRRQPEGYQTRVGERGVKLSGGEKQRVSIARAVLKKPRLYVFDEATSSLDSTTEREIMSNLRELSRSNTTLIITHRLSTVVHADEIVVLRDGTVAERGTHEELVVRGGSYAVLWRAQHPQLAHSASS
jgi:ATP-binding cassette subfamily B protein